MILMNINLFMYFLKKMSTDWADEPFDSPLFDEYWNSIQVESKQNVSLISVNF